MRWWVALIGVLALATLMVIDPVALLSLGLACLRGHCGIRPWWLPAAVLAGVALALAAVEWRWRRAAAAQARKGKGKGRGKPRAAKARKATVAK